MQEVIGTTEELIEVVKRDVKELVTKINHIRNTEDIGLKTMAKLHGVLMDCKAALQSVERFKGKILDVEQVTIEFRRFKHWLADAYQRVTSIMELDRVVTVADCEAEEKIVEKGSILEPIMNWPSMKCLLIFLTVTCAVVALIMNGIRLLA